MDRYCVLKKGKDKEFCKECPSYSFCNIANEEFKDCSNCGNADKKECYDCVGNNKWIPKKENDLVNHPNHYISDAGLETIDVIEAFTSGLVGYEAVETGNILKYMCRWKKKNGLQDLKKAQWYLNRLIENVEKVEKEK